MPASTGRTSSSRREDQLVGQDTDTLADVYDARIGRRPRLPESPAARGECIRDDCKATPSAGPELPFGGSEGLSGPGNVSRRRGALRQGSPRPQGQGQGALRQAAMESKPRTTGGRDDEPHATTFLCHLGAAGGHGVVGGHRTPATAADFGISQARRLHLDRRQISRQAGAHSDLTTEFQLNTMTYPTAGLARPRIPRRQSRTCRPGSSATRPRR